MLGVATLWTPYNDVMSQSYTTFTSLTTATNTQMSTIVIGTTTLSELTTSTLNSAVGDIPPVQNVPRMPIVCFYYAYQLQLDPSVKEVDGTISASSQVNYYLMSKDQYVQFNAYQPPCGSSYVSLSVQYGVKSYVLQFTPPVAGDYYIILENTSAYPVSYNVQVALVRNRAVAIYSTSTTLLIATSQNIATSTIMTSTAAGQSAFANDVMLILVAVVLAAIVIALRMKRTKTRAQMAPNTPAQ